MIKSLQSLLNHRFLVSLALTETGNVQTLRIRTAYVAAAVTFALSGWLALALAGDLGRAHLAALAGDTQAKHYIAMIDDLKRERAAEREQVRMMAQELGALQLRLDRFDALGNKLQAEGTLISDAPDEGDLKNGKGGPLAESPLGELDIDDVQAQLGQTSQKADFAELALETSLAMNIRKAMGPVGGGVPFYWPLMSDASRLSSNFGWRKDPVRGGRAYHAGFDIADKIGTPVVAAAEGTVVFAGWRFGYGNLVEIKHANGFSTRYGHLQKTIAREGDRVSAGTLVALMGNTGRSTGPHLHFEVRKGDQALNPYPFVKDTRMEVMQAARNGKGKELLAEWRTRGKKTAAK
jgi:murein DD-endopeptidase MepM/ murein hydrolase activator NlpD